jgi:hypothetical protein
MSWNLILDDNFARADGTPGNGWIDVHGSTWAIVSSQLKGTGDNVDGNEWSRDFLLRPTSENQLDQRIVTTIGLGNPSGAHLWHVHRYNPNSGTPTAYILEFEIKAGTAAIAFYSISGASATLIHSENITAGSTSNTFVVETRVTGANPTTLEMVVAENGTQIGDVYYGPIGGTGDSTAGLQVSGQSGYTVSSASRGTSVYIADFKSYNDVTQSISVSPTSVLTSSTGNSLTITGVATNFSGMPFAASGGTITGTVINSVTSATLSYSAPSVAGNVTITDTGSGKTCMLAVAALATDFSLSPSSLSTSPTVATGNYTVTLNGTLSTNETIALSDGGAGGTFTPSSLTFTSGNAGTPKTFIYTPPSGTGGTTKTLTATGSGAFSTSHSASCAVTSGPAVIAINDANLVWSPYNWSFDGTTKAAASAAGAYLKIGFSGTSCQLNIQTSQYMTYGVTPPKVLWSVDGGAWQSAQLTTSQIALSLASSLASGSHTVDVILDAENGAQGWANISNGLWISSIQLDVGSGTIARTDTLPKRMLIYGDSILQGQNSTGPGSPGTASDSAVLTFGRALAFAFGAEFGALGYGGQGYCGWASGANSGNPIAPPPLFTPANDAASSWNKYYQGLSRLVSSLLAPAPDYIVIAMGRNDYAVGNSTVAASVGGLLAALRAAAPSAKIFAFIPFAGSAITGITNGFNAYQAAAPDSSCFLLNTHNDSLFNYSIQAGPTIPTKDAPSDGTHPWYAFHGVAATEMAQLMQQSLDISGTATAGTTPGYPRSRVVNV